MTQKSVPAIFGQGLEVLQRIEVQITGMVLSRSRGAEYVSSKLTLKMHSLPYWKLLCSCSEKRGISVNCWLLIYIVYVVHVSVNVDMMQRARVLDGIDLSRPLHSMELHVAPH